MKHSNIDGLEQPISELVLGTMACSPDNQDVTNALLDAFVAAGGTCLDTAHIYGGGKSERAIGNWLRMGNNREKMVVLDKGAHHDSSGPRVNPECILADLTESLDRLQIETIDLYLLHRDDPNVPVGPIVECLNEQYRLGRIRAFGGSNWTTERIQEANNYAGMYGLKPFVASSPHLSLAVPAGPMWAGCVTLDEAGKQWHKEHQFPLFPWSAQASGFFTGRYAPDIHTNADVERIFYSEQNWERLKRAQEIGVKRGITANNIALAYVLHQPFPVFALFGPRTVEELESSLPALGVTLTEEEIHYLEA